MMFKSEIDGLLKKYLNLKVKNSGRLRGGYPVYHTDPVARWSFDYTLNGVDDDDDRTVYWVVAQRIDSVTQFQTVRMESVEALEAFLRDMPKVVVSTRSDENGFPSIHITSINGVAWIDEGKRTGATKLSVLRYSEAARDGVTSREGRTWSDDAEGCFRMVGSGLGWEGFTEVSRTSIFPLIDALLESDLDDELKEDFHAVAVGTEKVPV